ncbi:MAG: hypothetical protein NTY14_04695 [Candidatus Omnitrophica bacterium]|nr:hypothetical protein [Candidatus Omnitrophota bacterium]
MARSKFNELKGVFKALHGPKGCLWDKKQTHQSLVSDLKEEVEEFIDTVNKNDPEHMKEELGDLLLHVMFNAQIASKNKKFDIEDVIEGLIRKLKHRHPHVFGNTKVRSTSQIIRNWNKIKKLEKESKLRKI